jgi:hypothetical protein
MIMANDPGSGFKPANSSSSSSTSFAVVPDKENVNIFSPQQQQQNKIFSFSSPTPPSQRQSSYEQRFRAGATSTNPLAKIFGSSSTSTGSGRAAAKQREIFLNKVKRDRDNGRFAARGESVMMMEYLSEQRQWDERMRRNAQKYQLAEGEAEDQNEDELDVGEETDPEQYALDEFLSLEEQEEMMMMLEVPPAEHHHRHKSLSPARSDDRSSFYGDDEIDYDDIFMDLAGDHNQGHVHSQDMDMSG